MVKTFSWSGWPKTTHSYVLPALLLLAPGCEPLAEDTPAVQEKVAGCAACHGADGKSIAPEIPNLAGQHSSYLQTQLQAFKSGQRANEIMSPMAAALEPTDMKTLADYYSRKPMVVGAADPKLVRQGEQLYRGGRTDTHTPACMACHGPSGHGNGAANFPALAGQQAGYTAKQLRDYRSGARATDAQKVMRSIAATLRDPDIDALASYIQGLHD